MSRNAARAAITGMVLAGGAMALGAQATPFFRPVDVPAPGWVRVPLDLAALRHVGLASSLRITAPTGEDPPRWTAPYIEDSERRPVKVLEVAKDERGWTLRLDVGPEPLVHERLLLALGRLTVVPDVALDASQDGKTWEPLVAGSLFRLGDGEGLARTFLPYPATSARYLRLSWPAEAGFPELRSVLVEPTAPGKSLTVTSRSNPCRDALSGADLRGVSRRATTDLQGVSRRATADLQGVSRMATTGAATGAATGGATASLVCRLPLPAAGLTVRQLTVELAAAAPLSGGSQPAAAPPEASRRTTVGAAMPAVGYRLYQPRQGTWQPLAAGVWRGARSARHVLPLGSEPLAGDELRLELYGASGDPAPRLLAHSFDLAVDTVLFYAAAPGRYTLSYGGTRAPAPGAAQPDAAAVAAGIEAAWIPPGIEEEARNAPLPAAAAPGAILSRERFRAAWAVIAAGAAPGDLVRLELPDAVYGQARADLGDLRLVMASRQIPYVRWSPPEPVPVVERSGLRPEAEKGRHYSRIEVYLPATGLPVTQLQLTAAPSPLRRPIGIRYPDPGPPGLAQREERLVARDTWECLPEPPLPCRLALPLAGPAPSYLTVRFADGDNAPLPTVDVAAWRRGDVLFFAWPGQGKVQLLAGARDLTAPTYDLSALAEVLPLRPAQIAELDLTGEGLKEGVPPWWASWVIPAVLVFAALSLLVLLRRILCEQAPPH